MKRRAVTVILALAVALAPIAQLSAGVRGASACGVVQADVEDGHGVHANHAEPSTPASNSRAHSCGCDCSCAPTHGCSPSGALWPHAAVTTAMFTANLISLPILDLLPRLGDPPISPPPIATVS